MLLLGTFILNNQQILFATYPQIKLINYQLASFRLIHGPKELKELIERTISIHWPLGESVAVSVIMNADRFLRANYFDDKICCE